MRQASASFLFFVFCLPSCLMELLWLSTQQGQKRSFFFQNPANQVSGFGTAKRKKCIFPLSKMISLGKYIHQPRLKKKNKKTSYMSFYCCSFSGRSNKIPAQPDSCVYICIYIYINIYKEKIHTLDQQLHGGSAVHAAVCQFGEITCWKNWNNL